MTYYIEYIFLENFIIDFILIYVTGSLLKKNIIIRRILVASLIGAIYVLAIAILNQIFISNIIVKLFVSILMLTIAYNPINVIDYVRLVLCFYIISFVIVGILIATNYFFNTNEMTIKIIFEASFFAIIIFKAVFEEIKRKTNLYQYIRTINIELNNKKIKIRGLIDTGNELMDVITNKPVIIVEMESIFKLLDQDTITDIKNFYSDVDNNYLDIFLKLRPGINFRLIKYNTISSKEETMLGIVPDEIFIEADNKNKIILKAIVGIYPEKLNKENEYKALLHKELLQWESEI